MRFLSPFAFLAVFVLGGCNKPNVAFDPRAAAFINEKGSTRVDVHAFFRAGNGRVVYAAGEYVHLVPVTPYSEQRIAALYGGRKLARVQLSIFDDPDPEYKKYVRSVKAESSGKASFENVAPGEYFVASTVTVFTPDMIFPDGGAIYERVTVTGKEKEAVKVIVSGK